MTPEDWTNGFARAVAVFLNGEAILAPDKRGQRVVDDSFVVVFNAHYEPIEFVVPPKEYGSWWSTLLDTADDNTGSSDSGDTYSPGDVLAVAARSLLVLTRPLEPTGATAATSAATGSVSQPSAARAVQVGASLERRPSSSGGSGVPAPTPARRREDPPAPPRRFGR